MLLALVLGTQYANACVNLMGESPDSLVVHPPGDEWNYGFRGKDWVGVDGNGNPWVCTTGTEQSPVNLVNPRNYQSGSLSTRTTWSYSPITSTGSNVQIFNNGHTIQVQWSQGALASNVEVVTTSSGGLITDVVGGLTGLLGLTNTKKARATPLQFHFHTDSEHLIDGKYHPLELHIVHNIPKSEMESCPNSGCLMVTGTLLQLTSSDNPNLTPIFNNMPVRQGVVNQLPVNQVINMQNLLPADKDYVLYKGSLTTPPCSEGVIWHVMLNPIPISLNQLEQFQTAVGLTECSLINGTSTAGRKLLRNGHTHESPVARLVKFHRGAYSGFVPAEELPAEATTTGRSLLTATNPNDFNCTIGSLGFNNRRPLPLNTRNPFFFSA